MGRGLMVNGTELEIRCSRCQSRKSKHEILQCRMQYQDATEKINSSVLACLYIVWKKDSNHFFSWQKEFIIFEKDNKD